MPTRCPSALWRCRDSAPCRSHTARGARSRRGQGPGERLRGAGRGRAMPSSRRARPLPRGRAALTMAARDELCDTRMATMPTAMLCGKRAVVEPRLAPGRPRCPRPASPRSPAAPSPPTPRWPRRTRGWRRGWRRPHAEGPSRGRWHRAPGSRGPARSAPAQPA